MRHADAACGMRQQLATIRTHRSDFICVDADAANRFGRNSNSKFIRTRIGKGIPRTDVNTDVDQLKQIAERY